MYLMFDHMLTHETIPSGLFILILLDHMLLLKEDKSQNIFFAGIRQLKKSPAKEKKKIAVS